MGKETGILRGDNNDILIVVKRDAKGLIMSGMVVGDVTLQNQALIIYSEKGEIKENPYLGVGLIDFIDDDDPSELLREVRTNLRADGQTVQRCGFNSEGKLVVVGGYGNN